MSVGLAGIQYGQTEHIVKEEKEREREEEAETDLWPSAQQELECNCELEVFKVTPRLDTHA